MKKVASFALKLSVTVLLFTLLFRPELFGLAPDAWGENITLRGLLAEIRAVETHNLAFWLAFAALVRLVGMFFGVVRWRLLLQGQGLHMPFWYMAQSWFAGRSIGIFLPGTIGLDGYRLYDSSRCTGEVIKCTTVVAIEKLIGVISLTLLVFLTFPLGMGLLEFRLPVLAVSMTVFAGVILVSMLTLLNPRVIQRFFAILPAPESVRDKVQKLGAAASAYGSNRGMLLLAVGCGLIVHGATCLMFVGTMAAIRADNVSVGDIFFTSPLMIWATVLGPSVGGEGIREIVFTTLLAARGGTQKAFLIAHLGWWVGDFVPFLVGLPILLFRKRPGKEEVREKLEQARAAAAEVGSQLPSDLGPEDVLRYRQRVMGYVLAGLGAGLIAGALAGLGEATWFAHHFSGLRDLGVLWWAPLAYPLLFVPVALGIVAVFLFIALLTLKFLSSANVFALVLGGASGAAALLIGGFRFYRDILAKHAPEPSHIAMIIAGALAAAVVAGVLGRLLAAFAPKSRRGSAIATAALFVGLVAAGGIGAVLAAPRDRATAFESTATASGPSIFFIVLDASRADVFRFYSEDANTSTPHTDRFVQDAVVFSNAFAESSWTKPAFGTMFTGLYPEGHTATSQASVLPNELTTFAEVLAEGGYYNQAFANNPNITTVFNFDQGFHDYADLKPDRHFGAPPSAVDTVLYQALRRIRGRVRGRLPWAGVRVTDQYQPAEVVTEVTLEWLDGPTRPEDAPFMLFAHYMDTHDPFMDWRQPGVGYARVTLGDPEPEPWRDLMFDAYLQEVEYFDTHFGALLEGLRERDLYDDSLIIFVSDHGEEFHDHGGWWHGQTLYDELIQIPLVVKFPGNAWGGTRDPGFARHLDLPPTIIHYAGLEQPEAMTGHPLISRDGVSRTGAVQFVYAENDHEGIVLQAVRTRDEKLIVANEGNKRSLAPVEFYDLVQDPRETDNLADLEDPRQSELRELIDGMRAFILETGAEPQFQETIPESLQEQLGGLGYLGD